MEDKTGQGRSRGSTYLLGLLMIFSYLILGIAPTVFAVSLTALMLRKELQNPNYKNFVLVFIGMTIASFLVVFLLALIILWVSMSAGTTSEVTTATHVGGLCEIILTIIIVLYLWRTGAFTQKPTKSNPVAEKK